MKRIFALVVAFIIITASVTVVFADDGSEKVSYQEISEDSVSFECEYKSDTKTVEIHGNVNYDALVNYSKYTIEIYKILPNQSVEAAINAEESQLMASMAITVKFDLSFGINSSTDPFFKYALLLRSPDGDFYLVGSPRYILVEANQDNIDANGAFKGIYSAGNDVSVYGDLGFGTAIIPVYYDKLINTSSNGYMYPYEDGHCFFDKEYIDSLGAKILTYSTTGAKVYLQLLLSSDTKILSGSGGNTAGATYDLPDVYDSDTISKISTYTGFLASRFNNYKVGNISGFIVGKKIDKKAYNYYGNLSEAAYANKYAYYLMIIANSARYENPKLDIVIPISDADSYGDVENSFGDELLPTDMLENISKFFYQNQLKDLKYSLMIEADSPLLVSDGTDNKKIVPYDIDAVLTVSEMGKLESFTKRLEGQYRSAPQRYMYLWNVPSYVNGNLLSASYAYGYYSLMEYTQLSSFVLSLSGGYVSMEPIYNLVNYIDTEKGISETDPLLAHMGAEAWAELIENFDISKAVTRNIYFSDDKKLGNENWLGSFSYFDFESGDTTDWVGNSYSKNLKSDYGTDGRRALCQLIGKPNGAAHSDTFYLYEYEENFEYTPALLFKVMITDGGENNGNLYELTVTIGSERTSVSNAVVVSSGILSELWVDVSKYNIDNNARYVKLSTRPINGEDDEYTMWLYDVIGYSKEYDNEELLALVEAERQNIRNQSDEKDGILSDSTLYWIALFIILTAIIIAGVMLILLRRDDGALRRRIREKNDKDNL